MRIAITAKRRGTEREWGQEILEPANTRSYTILSFDIGDGGGNGGHRLTFKCA